MKKYYKIKSIFWVTFNPFYMYEPFVVKSTSKDKARNRICELLKIRLTEESEQKTDPGFSRTFAKRNLESEFYNYYSSDDVSCEEIDIDEKSLNVLYRKYKQTNDVWHAQ